MRASPTVASFAIMMLCGFSNAGLARQPKTPNEQFSICESGQRITCVVDGDTFWLRGVKIRIADIDTPELSPPRCERERRRGMAAKQRLLDILNSGPIFLKSTARDEDRFGRNSGSFFAAIDLSAKSSLPKAWRGSGTDHVGVGVIETAPTDQRRESVSTLRFKTLIGRRIPITGSCPYDSAALPPLRRTYRT
ncbi:hypothetical protein SAMN03159406_04671 [Rhizobium sp. NFR03]|nr:hypothetical protein SAMN03159406_04671 [Rhizobium sp. NFR03]